MKHFIIDITYKVPAEQVAEVRPAHREYLQERGYSRGLLLFSGPKVPPDGGLEVARAGSREEIDQFIASDPFNIKGVAEYRVIEFDPTLRQGWILDWITGEK